MAAYLITGAARGLGLAMATQLATYPSSEVDRVFVTARGESTALNILIQSSAGKVQFIRMDPTKESSIKEAVAEVDRILDGYGLDVLINNAGQSFALSSKTTGAQLEDQLNNNILSVHQVTRKFVPLLQRGSMKKVINMTPELSSSPRGGRNHAYKTSKAALESLTMQYSSIYAAEGFTFLAMNPDLNPDWLRADTSSTAPFEAAASAALSRIMSSEREDSGLVLNIRVEGWERHSMVDCRS